MSNEDTRKREDAAATDAMRALAEAKKAESIPVELIEDLEQAVAIIYTEIVVDRAMEQNPPQHGVPNAD